MMVIHDNPACKFKYDHFYGEEVCDVPMMEKQESAHEEPLADWERELLLGPVENREVHMIPHEFGTGCNIKLDDGKVHLVTGNFSSVTCDECKIKWLEYENDQLKAEVEKQKEKVRVAEQATGMVRRDLRNSRLRVKVQDSTIRSLRQDVEYLRGGPQYYVDPYSGRTRPRY